MRKPIAGVLLAFAGLSLLGLVFLLRRPAPVQSPAAPLPSPKTVPVTPALPSLRPALPAPEPSGDPLLARWRGAILLHNSREVLDLQSQFLAREADYRESLRTMAQDDSDPRIRAFSVAVLGRMKTPPPEAYFLERTGDAHEFPRTSALQALEKLGTQACLGTADRLASGDPAESVRAAAAKAAKAVRAR